MVNKACFRTHVSRVMSVVALLGVRLHTSPEPGHFRPALSNHQKQISSVQFVQSGDKWYTPTFLSLLVLNHFSRFSLMAHYLRANPLPISSQSDLSEYHQDSSILKKDPSILLYCENYRNVFRPKKKNHCNNHLCFFCLNSQYRSCPPSICCLDSPSSTTPALP